MPAYSSVPRSVAKGRNFQFAHHLILWDLPENPELVEQRIGRLDRIGQTDTIHIHLPYIPGTSEEVWVQFYNQGVGIFNNPVPTALILAHQFGEKLASLSEKFDTDNLDAVVTEVSDARKDLGEQLENGYLRLLARNSNKPGQSEVLREQIQACDTDSAFETFATDLMEYVGLRVEDLGDRRYLFKPEYGQMDSLPGLDPKGMMATFDRTDALNRDDIQFYSGSSAASQLARLTAQQRKRQRRALRLSGYRSPRYFPASYLPCRMCGTPRFTYRSLPRHFSHHSLARSYREIISAPDLSAEHLNHSPDTDDILGNAGIKRLVKKMRKSAEAHMFQVTEDLVEEARVSVEQELQSEISRLQNLARLNPSVDQQEIKNLQAHQTSLEEALAETRFRLDSLHLVVVEN